MGGVCCSEEGSSGQAVQTIDPKDEKGQFEANALFSGDKHGDGKKDGSGDGAPQALPGDDIVGDWITERGRYSVTRGPGGELTFLEQCSKTHILTGVLTQAGEWWQTEIKNKLEGDKVYGYLRLRVEGSGLRSSFKKLTPNAEWDQKGFFARRV
eukprot:CAMPEP_0206573558 /NCGR_PEP_ID=MMETSP0325_2-20121206/28913_1 /ASSEMBLY_ACC=CAM_ASM_000347 /TAXON_ID=2866 /ORGANISM="Crypthecodinium cohnii, Strain Seligo" /LENGTH=153 /DNA_ID=CAMNT_0054077977 /DNA_START=158 /DNA_END=619 /DNA_ORIENTATION=+